MTDTDPATKFVALLRQLQADLAGLSQKATEEALGKEWPQNLRRDGRAQGLHEAWGLVADLADRVQEKRA